MAFAGLVLGVSSFANAGLIEFNYESSLNSTSISGTTLADTYQVSILLDNGSNDFTSQNWFISDIISVEVSIGSYWAKFTDAFFQPTTDIVFTTSALGDITFSDFEGTNSSPNHEDIFGSGSPVYMYGDGVKSFNNNTAIVSDYGHRIISSWTYSSVEVPEPSTLTILALGLMGLASRRFMKKS